MLDVTAKNFSKEVLKSKIPVLVDFWGPTCGPCRAMVPILDQLAESSGGKFKVVKVNVQEETTLGGQYSVMSLPTLMVFKDGKPVASRVGAGTKAILEREFSSFLS